LGSLDLGVGALLALVAAAFLEVGGDALVRGGLNAGSGLPRFGLIGAGGLVLLAYGLAVNAPAWDFGRLLGCYVAVFFVVAQVVNFAAFGQRPGGGVLAGGALIVAGGLTVAAWRD
jgi:hypothetical protein